MSVLSISVLTVGADVPASTAGLNPGKAITTAAPRAAAAIAESARYINMLHPPIHAPLQAPRYDPLALWLRQEAKRFTGSRHFFAGHAVGPRWPAPIAYAVRPAAPPWGPERGPPSA